ncbi:hypothetical protein [Methanosarcina sp.]|uniref:hypothetical protein n=1 Tax=Methanosarcina sp. TaxID=2213 RepID=UPI003BB60854
MEQIEEATIQIDKKTTTGSRLALILIDNALELSIWEKINSKYSIDNEDYEEVISGKFRAQLLKDYEYFNNKTNFLVSEGMITQKEKEIYDTCHFFRNEVYHQNIIRELIINDLAKIYLKACCNVIVKLFDSSFYIFDYMKPVPEILTKYEIVNSYGILKDDKIDKAVNTFFNTRVCSPLQFSQTLALDINKRIEKVREDINYVEHYIEPASTNIEPASTNIEQASTNIEPASTNIEPASTTPLTFEKEKSSLESFSRRANQLKRKNDTSNALTRYYNIDKDLIPIEFSTNFISDMLSREMEFRYEQYRDERYLEMNDLQ